jgi:hypothetical protein
MSIMPKKEKPKVVSLPNAENYIRTKARQLPITEVLVNKDWRASGMATIVVAREHVNGNITAGFYLVDLNLFGVKDTYYMFNTADFIYKEKVNMFLNKLHVLEIDYNLAHNIIFEAVAFAEDCGFKPHRDFIKITQYLLKEDDDSIELTDIDCGHEGKPFYVQGPADDNVKSRRILTHLDEKFGEGNYHYILDSGIEGLDGEFEEDEYEEDEWDDLEDHDGEEEEFLDLFNKFDSLDEIELLRYFELSDNIFSRFVQELTVQDYLDQLMDEIPNDIRDDAMTSEFLGIDYPIERFERKTLDMIRKLVEDDMDFAKAQKLVKKLPKETQVIPYIQLCEIHFNKDVESELYLQKLESCHRANPDYPLLHMAYTHAKANKEKDNEEQVSFKEASFSLGQYTQRPYLYQIELIRYLSLYLDMALIEGDLARIEALSRAYHVLDQFNGMEIIGILIHHAKSVLVLGELGMLNTEE